MASTVHAGVAVPLPRRRRLLGPAVLRVLGVVGVARSAQFVEAALFPLVAIDRGLGVAAAAGVLLVLALGSTAGAVIGGTLVDRLGARAVVVAGLASASAGALILCVSGDLALLAAGSALYGSATGAWRLGLEIATAQSLSVDDDDRSPHEARERAFGMFVWLVNVGALASAAALVAGLDLQLAVGIQAALTGTAALLASALVPRVGVASPGVEGSRRVATALWVLALGYAPFTIVMFQAFSGLAVVFEGAEYRWMVLVNAATLVAFPLVLWRVLPRIDGGLALMVAGLAQGSGVATAALTADPILTTVAWSAGEATLIAVIPAVVTGLAPHAAAGRFRAGFAAVQGIAAAGATFFGPLVAHWSVDAFAGTILALTALGTAAIHAQRRSISLSLQQPLACPCGALACECDASHTACAFPTPVVVRRARA